MVQYSNILIAFLHRSFVINIIMLPDTHIQEEISRAYIKAVCNHAGYVLCLPERDYGLDVNVKGVNMKPNGNKFNYRFTGINVDIQLKSTINYQEDGTNIIYDLDSQAFTDLIEPQVIGTKRILVLLLLPEEKSEWISQGTEALALKKCAYWISLEGLPNDLINSSTNRIKIPKRNIFSGEALDKIMQAIKNKEDLTNV